MEGKVIVFFRTSSVARAPVYAHLRARGLTLVLVHPISLLPPAFSGLFHYHLCADTCRVDVLLPVLTAFLAEAHLTPDAIVSFDEYAVYTAAVAAAHFGLRSLPLPPAQLQENNLKASFRLFCQRHQLTAPKGPIVLEQPLWWRDCTQDSGAWERLLTYAAEALGPLTLPVVLKPSPGAGSLLVRRCDTVAAVAAHALFMWAQFESHPDMKHFRSLTQQPAPPTATTTAATAGMRHSDRGCCSSPASSTTAQEANMKNGADEKTTRTEEEQWQCDHAMALATTYGALILVEEYIDGSEVDVDAVVERGEVVFCAISDNFPTAPPYFAETGGLCPSALPTEALQALRDLFFAYVRVQGTALHGVLHFEAKYDARRKTAYIIEVNCRLGSAETNTMLKTAYGGLELGECFARCALGLPVRPYVQSVLGARGSAAVLSDTVAVAAALGGSRAGFYPAGRYAASVNLYPQREGVLTKVQLPAAPPTPRPLEADLGGAVPLVGYSLSAIVGDHVCPPPKRMYLLCWMVTEGASAAEAVARIQYLTEHFVQQVEGEGEEEEQQDMICI